MYDMLIKHLGIDEGECNSFMKKLSSIAMDQFVELHHKKGKEFKPLSTEIIQQLDKFFETPNVNLLPDNLAKPFINFLMDGYNYRKTTEYQTNLSLLARGETALNKLLASPDRYVRNTEDELFTNAKDSFDGYLIGLKYIREYRNKFDREWLILAQTSDIMQYLIIKGIHECFNRFTFEIGVVFDTDDDELPKSVYCYLGNLMRDSDYYKVSYEDKSPVLNMRSPIIWIDESRLVAKPEVPNESNLTTLL